MSPEANQVQTAPAPQVPVRYGGMRTLTVHLVPDQELDQLVHAAPESIDATIGFSCLFSGLSLLASILLTTVRTGWQYTTVLVASVALLALSVPYLLLSRRSHRTAADIASAIRKRAPPDDALPPVPPPALEIVRALYGPRDPRTDVTAKVRSLVASGRLDMDVWPTALLDVDPMPGYIKTLVLTYRLDGVERTIVAKDREKVAIPQQTVLPERAQEPTADGSVRSAVAGAPQAARPRAGNQPYRA